MKPYCTLIFLLFTASAAHAAGLPPEVIQSLKEARIPIKAVGVLVQEVSARAPLVRVNETRAMNPASTIKLLTTYAGLEMLGPAYTWKTEAYLNGTLEKDVLEGDLILKGYGNPKLTIEQFWLWLRELRDRGLRDIRGHLVLDRSAFSPQPHDPAAFDNEPVRPYNTGPDALLLNFNALRLRFIPEGEKIRVSSDPPLAGIVLDNRLETAPQPLNCQQWDDEISAHREGGAVVVQGSFPMHCGECEQHVCPLPNPEYVYAAFRSLWQEMGGTLQGDLRDGIVQEGARLFSTHYSAPLSELIRDINKFSNNVMARQLFLTLGTAPGSADPVIKVMEECMEPSCPPDNAVQEASPPAASLARSEQALSAWLARKGLHFPELVLENGAGLSRAERISPLNMSLLLQHAQRSPLSAEFEASLPIAGVDGTLKKRLNNSSTPVHAHLKTGSLEGVKSVAGYVQAKSGRQFILVFFVNHPNAGAAQAAQDALIEWVQRL